jgi:hypothetical protein
MLMHPPPASRGSFIISRRGRDMRGEATPIAKPISRGAGYAPLIPLGLSRGYRPLIMVDEPCRGATR